MNQKRCRQTQSVLPLTRTLRNNSGIHTSQMSETLEEHSGPNERDENQSMITLLKTIIENQNMQVSSAAACYNACHFQAPIVHHCHCQNQIQSSACQEIRNESPATSEDSSITSLLKTVIKNQAIQSSCTGLLNRCPSNFRQPTFCNCQGQSNSCVKETKGISSIPNRTESTEDSSTQSILNSILENQSKMTLQLEILIKMQEIVMKKLDGRGKVVTVEVDQPLPTPNRISFRRIDSVEDCHEFEDKLKKPDFASNMLRHFEPVCGNSDLYGDNVAYTLVDHIFTRRLFTLVTWSGATRGTESKECFLKFERIFEFFFDLVRKTDPNYSIKSLKDFFQKIISNSKRRAEHKRLRMSRVKNSKIRTSLMQMRGNFSRLNATHEISDEISDNDDEPKDNTSQLSYECITDEATLNQDAAVKAEDETD